LIRLAPNQFSLLEQIYPVCPGPQTFFHLIRNRLGEGYADSVDNPRCGFIRYNEDMIVVGDSLTDKFQQWLNVSDFIGLFEIQNNISEDVNLWFPDAIKWDRIGFEAVEVSEVVIPESVELKRLSLSDVDNLDDIGEKWLWKFAGTPAGLIENCDNFGVFKEGKLVSISSVFTSSRRYDDIAVATHPAYRGKGYALLCAGALTGWLLKRGRKPVWNTSPENIASMKIPFSLGYREIKLRTSLFKIRWNNQL